MEQALKQRLVGAAVLVALAVILVPMVLDGGYRPPPHTPRNDMAPMPQEPAAPDFPHLPGKSFKKLTRGSMRPRRHWRRRLASASRYRRWRWRRPRRPRKQNRQSVPWCLRPSQNRSLGRLNPRRKSPSRPWLTR